MINWSGHQKVETYVSWKVFESVSLYLYFIVLLSSCNGTYIKYVTFFMYLYLFFVLILVLCTCTSFIYMYLYHVLVNIKAKHATKFSVCKRSFCESFKQLSWPSKETSNQHFWENSKWNLKQVSKLNVILGIWRKQIRRGGLQIINPSACPECHGWFEFFQWSSEFRLNITLDDAWLCQLSTLQSHSISCFIPTY